MKKGALPLDCRVAHAPRNDKGARCAWDVKGCVFGIGNHYDWSSFHVISLSLFLFVIASPTGRGNPVRVVVCAALCFRWIAASGSRPPRNDRVWGEGKGRKDRDSG